MTTPPPHFDEARVAAADAVRSWLGRSQDPARCLLIRDLFGRFHLAIWQAGSRDVSAIGEALRKGCGPWWTEDIVNLDVADATTRDLYEENWKAATRDGEDPQVRLLDRHRSRTAWFCDEEAPLWDALETGTAMVVFYSFKGGLGRSTALAACAMQWAQAGDRVCVIDFDLDSPGVGRLLAADAGGLTSPTGVVDFLVEHPVIETTLSDYYHRCDRVAGAGELLVFPAGTMDAAYADKLARVDFDETSYGHEGGLARLLHRVREELRPQWILIDARTGVSESAGRLLSGIAHLHVLMGTTQEQSWEGLGVVLDRLGKTHVEAGRAQGDVVLVQAMVPVGEAGRPVREAFSSLAERQFTERYYAAEDSDALWSVGDLDSQEAPHAAIPIEYSAQLASFADIAEVAEALGQGAYAALAERIAARFARETDE